MSALRQAALIFLAVTAVGVTPAGFSAQPAAAADQAATTAGKGESELLMAADLALREGNCRSASDSYLAAAKVSSQVQVARRAAQLALGCEQLSTARVAVARWRELDKYSADAALTAAVVALKRYDLAEARKALIAWRDSGSSASQDPLGFAELLEQQAEVTAVYRVFGELFANDDHTAEVLLA